MFHLRVIGAAMLVAALAAGAGRADELRVGALKYSNVVVTDFRDGEIFFRFRGNIVSKKLRDVRDLFLDAYPEIAPGEENYKAGRMDDAVRYYEALVPKVRADYIKALLRQRIADAKSPTTAEPKEPPKPVATKPPAPELSTPDAFLKLLRDCPLDRSQKDWAPKTSAWRTRMVDLRGQIVRWKLKGASVAETPGGLAVRARLGNRAVVAGLISPREASAIENAGYEPTITLQAIIGDYYARQSGRWQNVSLNPTMEQDSPLGVEMLEVVVTAAVPGRLPPEPVSPSPVRPERPRVRPETPRPSLPRTDPAPRPRPEPRPEAKPEPRPVPPPKTDPGPAMEPIQPVRPPKPVVPDIDIDTPPPPDKPTPMEPLPARQPPKRIELPKDHGRKTIFDF